jgi:Lar family restriction alleviation protein
MKMQNDKLLSCPFCGGKAFVDTHKFWDVEAKDFTVKTYGVRCYECQAGTMQYFRTEEDAIKQWNTRKPMERIVEQLESNKWDIHDWRDRWRNEIIDECIGVVKGGVDNATN